MGIDPLPCAGGRADIQLIGHLFAHLSCHSGRWCYWFFLGGAGTSFFLERELSWIPAAGDPRPASSEEEVGLDLQQWVSSVDPL